MTVFTTTSRTPIQWEQPATSVEDFYLLIDDSNFLLIDSTYKFIIQSGINETPWSTKSRNPITF